MKIKVFTVEVLALFLVALLAATPARGADKIGEGEAVQIGIDAYIYGYPLVTMEITRRVVTNVEKPEGLRAPMGKSSVDHRWHVANSGCENDAVNRSEKEAIKMEDRMRSRLSSPGSSIRSNSLSTGRS